MALLTSELVRDIGYVVGNEIVPMELLKSRDDVVYFGLATLTNVVLPISEIWYDTVGYVAKSIYQFFAGGKALKGPTAARYTAVAVMAANVPVVWLGLKLYQDGGEVTRFVGATMIVAAMFSTWTAIRVLFLNDIAKLEKLFNVKFGGA